MLICGLKLTHDGSIALIDDNRLVCSIELEKVSNNPRYTGIEETSVIESIMESAGYKISEVDHFAVDGWGGYNQDALAIQPRLEIGEKTNKLSCWNKGTEYLLDIAQYEERFLSNDICQEWQFSGLAINGHSYGYSSYLHVTGHVLSTYYSSPFGRKGEDAFILIWDGGMFPRLYYFDWKKRRIENLGPIFLLIGNIYTIFSQHFGPFRTQNGFAKDSLSVAGKVMAYVALGKVIPELSGIFDGIYEKFYQAPMGFANVFANEFKRSIAGAEYTDEDILCSFHHYLGDLLVKKLKKKISRYPGRRFNFCFAGGCALNIKWNSQIRDSKIFEEVFVAPFPNDSGSAIGAACAKAFSLDKDFSLDWNIYSGPGIVVNEPCGGWTSRSCTIGELASLLYEKGEPVVMLNGKAELGPRALGNRSIIAAPGSVRMKDILNEVKGRERYRPVSPVCLESKAKDYFIPGTTEPFMIFEHKVNPLWKENIPAVCHLDDTVRLQTVNHEQNSVIAELLTEFGKLGNVPVLCNTSANFNGSGFFPDVYSATKWGKVNYVWCEEMLYEKTEKIIFNL